MKLLLMANCSGGVYRFRADLIKKLMTKASVVVSTPRTEHFQDLCNLGCKIVETPLDRRTINPLTDFKLLLCYFALFRREKPDSVITYTVKPNIYGGILCRLLSIPYAANITGLGSTFQKKGVLYLLIKNLYKLALSRAHVVFFENSENMRIFLANKIVKDKQCFLLNGAGVNLNYYTQAPYPTEKNTINFLFIGRVMQEKGINELIEAVERLIREGYACTLDILGYFEENYEKIIAEKSTNDWFHYHGNQSDVRPYIENSHCFVLPSWHEGMANTNLECAAMGRPVITSNIHGCKEAIIDNVSGLLCEPKNAESLYTAMKMFCKMPYELRKKMGEEGRKHMEEVFDKERVVTETMKGLGL